MTPQTLATIRRIRRVVILRPSGPDARCASCIVGDAYGHTCEAYAPSCPAWSAWAGMCTAERGHHGAHTDRYGDAFRASPRRAR